MSTVVKPAEAENNAPATSNVTVKKDGKMSWYTKQSDVAPNDVIVATKTIEQMKTENIYFINQVRELKNKQGGITPYVVAVNRGSVGGAKTVFFSATGFKNEDGSYSVKAGDLLTSLQGITIQHRAKADDETGEIEEYLLVAKAADDSIFA